MQADWTRLQEHNGYLRSLYAQQFRNSREVADKLCECRQQVHSLRREISDLRQLVQLVPVDLLGEARMHTGKLVSLSTAQVQQTMQQQMVERRGIAFMCIHAADLPLTSCRMPAINRMQTTSSYSTMCSYEFLTSYILDSLKYLPKLLSGIGLYYFVAPTEWQLHIKPLL